MNTHENVDPEILRDLESLLQQSHTEGQPPVAGNIEVAAVRMQIAKSAMANLAVLEERKLQAITKLNRLTDALAQVKPGALMDAQIACRNIDERINPYRGKKTYDKRTYDDTDSEIQKAHRSICDVCNRISSCKSVLSLYDEISGELREVLNLLSRYNSIIRGILDETTTESTKTAEKKASADLSQVGSDIDSVIHSLFEDAATQELAILEQLRPELIKLILLLHESHIIRQQNCVFECDKTIDQILEETRKKISDVRDGGIFTMSDLRRLSLWEKLRRKNARIREIKAEAPESMCEAKTRKRNYAKAVAKMKSADTVKWGRENLHAFDEFERRLEGLRTFLE